MRLKLGAKGEVGALSNAFGELLYQAGLRNYRPHDGKAGCQKAGNAQVNDRRLTHEISFHSLRHSARTWLEEAGQPKAVIDALIGHEGDTGEIYTTVGDDALRDAAGVLGGFKC